MKQTFTIAISLFVSLTHTAGLCFATFTAQNTCDTLNRLTSTTVETDNYPFLLLNFCLTGRRC